MRAVPSCRTLGRSSRFQSLPRTDAQAWRQDRPMIRRRRVLETHAAFGDVPQVNFFRLTRMQPWTDRTRQLLRIKFVSRRGAAG